MSELILSDSAERFPVFTAISDHQGVKELAERARELGIMFHIAGFPFGADYPEHCATFGLEPNALRGGAKFGSTDGASV